LRMGKTKRTTEQEAEMEELEAALRTRSLTAEEQAKLDCLRVRYSARERQSRRMSRLKSAACSATHLSTAECGQREGAGGGSTAAVGQRVRGGGCSTAEEGQQEPTGDQEDCDPVGAMLEGDGYKHFEILPFEEARRFGSQIEDQADLDAVVSQLLSEQEPDFETIFQGHTAVSSGEGWMHGAGSSLEKTSFGDKRRQQAVLPRPSHRGCEGMHGAGSSQGQTGFGEKGRQQPVLQSRGGGAGQRSNNGTGECATGGVRGGSASSVASAARRSSATPPAAMGASGGVASTGKRSSAVASAALGASGGVSSSGKSSSAAPSAATGSSGGRRDPVAAIYSLFQALACVLFNTSEREYDAVEVSLLKSLPKCARQGVHTDFGISQICTEGYQRAPHFSMLLPVFGTASLVVWPNSHRVMRAAANAQYTLSTCERGNFKMLPHIRKKDSLLRGGATIKPEIVQAGSGEGIAFLGHLAHAGAENVYPSVHYRLHCYFMGKGADKADNVAHMMPVAVADACVDGVRILHK